jgi:hypothetical protein
MLAWLTARRRRRGDRGPNRETRRALDRMARPTRGELKRMAARLCPLSYSDREWVLDSLPPWQAEALRVELARRS